MEKGKVAVNLDQLGSVTGGTADAPAKYSVGDKVSLFVYPEYGVGKIIDMHLEAGGWMCTVEFDKGIITAQEVEFSPA